MLLVAGSIDYEEFLAATVNLNHLEKEDTMYNAFRHFDSDNSGYITQQELEDALTVRCTKFLVMSVPAAVISAMCCISMCGSISGNRLVCENVSLTASLNAILRCCKQDTGFNLCLQFCTH